MLLTSVLFVEDVVFKLIHGHWYMDTLRHHGYTYWYTDMGLHIFDTKHSCIQVIYRYTYIILIWSLMLLSRHYWSLSKYIRFSSTVIPDSPPLTLVSVYVFELDRPPSVIPSRRRPAGRLLSVLSLLLLCAQDYNINSSRRHRLIAFIVDKVSTRLSIINQYSFIIGNYGWLYGYMG